MGTVAEDLIDGMNFVVDHMEGKAKGRTHVVEIYHVDVKAIRQRLEMTQPQFAEAFGLDLAAVRAWEQRRRQPDRAARLYLKVIANSPETVRAAIAM